MASFLRTAAQLLLVIAVSVPEQSTSSFTRDVSETNCPPLQLIECKRGMRWIDHYAHIYDTDMGRNYLCDTKTDGGGWIVMQRRVHRTTFFHNDWYLYKHGFGSVCDDHWLGNKHVHLFTSSGKYELMIDMEHRLKNYTVKYDTFSIDDEEKQYALHIDGFNGNLKNDFSYHNDMKFSAMDKDNDNSSTRSCAKYYRAGWWFNDCHLTNLNGIFDPKGFYGFAVLWKTLTGYYTSVTAVEMKIRKV